MASFDEPTPGGGAGPTPTATPPPPEWVPPRHPWTVPPPSPGSVAQPSSPPLADAPGGSPPWMGSRSTPVPPPPPWSPAPGGPSAPRRFVFALVAALVIGGLLGAGIGRVVHIHGSRP